MSKDKDTYVHESVKRPRACTEETEPPHKQCKGDQDSDVDECDDLDNVISNVETGYHTHNDSAMSNESDSVNLQEVNDLMSEMEDFYNDCEETSGAIEESLAKTINSSLRSKISDSKFKELKAKYKRPDNCPNLMIPSVNEEVWTEKHPRINSIRSRDLKLQKIMGYMIKGMIPIIETTNNILKAALKKETFDPTQNLRKATDGVRMVAASYTQLNQYRKDNFKPVLTGKFKKLTFTNNSVTDQLFGDDLQKKLEDIQKSKKINICGFNEDKPSRSGYSANFNRNNYKSSFGKGRGCHFLGSRPPPNKRGRGGKWHTSNK